MERQILTTMIGSYPMPRWLDRFPTDQALRDATMMVFHLQQLVGLDLVVDGELRRFDVNHPATNGMIDYFIRPLRNIRTEPTRGEQRMFREIPGLIFREKAAGVVEGQLGEGTLDLVSDYHHARELTRQPYKFTVTSPYQLGMTLVDRHYKRREDLVAALTDILGSQVAEINAEVVQVDEEFVTGHPAEGEWFAPILNRLLDKIPKKAALHLCFGNYNAQTIQKGQWRDLIGFINSLHIDHVLVEMAARDPAEIACFQELRPEIGIGLGVVDVKRTQIETPEQIARTIEQAVQTLGPNRLAYVHPDCGMWMVRRAIADAKLSALVKGRDLYLGIRP